MSKKLFVDLSLLRRHRDFRNVFIARTISLLGLGMLSVAVPLQVHALTGDSLRVGLALALEGGGMFAGLLLGGVLADRHDRRKLILLARALCGLGFVGLAANAWLPAPMLWLVYLLSAWDGFFGALGVTALLASMPAIVGREHLMQARAISMASMRLATVISPAIGGMLIAAAGVGWAYALTACATGLTLLPLLRLPPMLPPRTDGEQPLRALGAGLRYLAASPVLVPTVLVGTLVTLTTAVRVLFPEMAPDPLGLGLMYSAVSLGATLGAMLSGWTEHLARPGRTMVGASLAAFGCLMLLGVQPAFPLLLVLLACFGYCVAIASLLQYGLVQGHTPDHYLGRVNGLWAAQDAAGDSLATVGIGLLGKLLPAAGGIFVLGAAASVLGLALYGLSRQLREVPLNDPALRVT